MKDIFIREETKQDHIIVYNLVKEAFLTAEHADGNEHDLVAALRNSQSFIPKLSLVAEINDKIVGHILLTKGTVGDNTVLILAPLSVLPEFQKQGVGTALVEAGHKIAKTLGYQYSLVLGSEKYYPRFGYLPANQFGVKIPEGMSAIHFMAKQLHDQAQQLSGSVTFAKEFGI